MLATFLHDEGLLRVDPDTALETGAPALFFPHGVGHLLGMDVHDLENYGDRPAYPQGEARPTQFGTAYLRLSLPLEANWVVTIEPGLYFVDGILDDPGLRALHRDHVDFDAADRWRGFGGIRIEDDVRVTTDRPEVLTAAAPKSVAAIEALVGTSAPFEVLGL